MFIKSVHSYNNSIISKSHNPKLHNPELIHNPKFQNSEFQNLEIIIKKRARYFYLELF
jgi:hypothetical protein